MYYRSYLEMVIRDLTFTVGKNERIGIVGHTGAGKSSVPYALVGLAEPASGQSIIDGVVISTIGLQDLRSHIAIIPEDPVLFEGVIPNNLNAANKHTDNEVWAAISADQISNILYTPTEKTLLWRRKIILLDETTVNMGTKTDQIMQDVVRHEFKECTMLTIAHCLGTIMNSDRILMMDYGQIAEFDTPGNIFTDKNSYFLQLVKSVELNHGV
ncbi:Multidrug resistance-associated protein 5 [Kickxella alabastrina]|nr:Multidrug resistance-associated protein 5 [Kickxella alabastrina]